MLMSEFNFGSDRYSIVSISHEAETELHQFSGKRYNIQNLIYTAVCFLPAFMQVPLGLLFDTEGGGDMLLRSVGSLSTDYTALYAIRQYSSRLL
jgi:hypothetical protein